MIIELTPLFVTQFIFSIQPEQHAIHAVIDCLFFILVFVAVHACFSVFNWMPKNTRAARAARTLQQSRVVVCKTTWNRHICGYHNLSIHLLMFNSLYSIKRRAYQSSFSVLLQHCRMQTKWNNRKIVIWAQMFIFNWRFLGWTWANILSSSVKLARNNNEHKTL